MGIEALCSKAVQWQSPQSVPTPLHILMQKYFLGMKFWEALASQTLMPQPHMRSICLKQLQVSASPATTLKCLVGSIWTRTAHSSTHVSMKSMVTVTGFQQAERLKSHPAMVATMRCFTKNLTHLYPTFLCTGSNYIIALGSESDPVLFGISLMCPPQIVVNKQHLNHP